MRAEEEEGEPFSCDFQIFCGVTRQFLRAGRPPKNPDLARDFARLLTTKNEKFFTRLDEEKSLPY